MVTVIPTIRLYMPWRCYALYYVAGFSLVLQEYTQPQTACHRLHYDIRYYQQRAL